MSQFRLLRSRRFLPLFLTQFLGAFNDNVYKNALVILITFKAGTLLGMDSNLLVVFSGGVFILPFFLFSASAGQLADKYEKAGLIRQVKLLEIVIMGCAVLGFYLESLGLLILLLFLMGAQSTLFGPLKYAILPQHLALAELTGGNGLIAMGTFLAILLGTMLGGVVVAIQPHGPLWVAGTVVALAVLGWLASRHIPQAEALDGRARIDWNPARQTWRVMRYAGEERGVLVAVIAVSWFWFAGATFLSQLPAFGKELLGGGPHVVTLLLTLFSVGIGAGSLLCNRLSGGGIEPGLVPLGALGISLFSIDVYFAGQVLPASSGTQLRGVAELLALPGTWRIFLDLAMIGLCGGLYIVPLQAMIQARSLPQHRARIIAANNILNALFMVGSALGTMALLRAGYSIPAIFLVTGMLNALLGAGVLIAQPEFARRCAAWLGARRGA